jgi:hypothetical protein
VLSTLNAQSDETGAGTMLKNMNARLGRRVRLHPPSSIQRGRLYPCSRRPGEHPPREQPVARRHCRMRIRPRSSSPAICRTGSRSGSSASRPTSFSSAHCRHAPIGSPMIACRIRLRFVQTGHDFEGVFDRKLDIVAATGRLKCNPPQVANELGVATVAQLFE